MFPSENIAGPSRRSWNWPRLYKLHSSGEMRRKKNPIASPPTATSRCHIAATETILLPNGRGEEKLLTRWIRHHWKSTALFEDQFSSQGFDFIMLSGCTREQNLCVPAYPAPLPRLCAGWVNCANYSTACTGTARRWLCFPDWLARPSRNYLHVCFESVHPPLLAASIF